MRYLTHCLLHQQIPRRGRRDSFGLDSARCWCCFLTSLRAKPQANVAQSDAIASKVVATNLTPAITSHHRIDRSSPTPITAKREPSIELSILTSPSHPSSPETHTSSLSYPSTATSLSPADSPPPPPCQPTLPTPPPKAHCRKTTLHSPPTLQQPQQ